MAKVLIAEDDPAINNLIFINLKLVGHECIQVFDGDLAIEAAVIEHFDLIVLDIMLPKQSGFEVIKQINNTPVIFVTAKGNLNDKLKGLSLGADDYIVKPFEILELVARVEAVLRRTSNVSDSFSFDDISVDFKSKQVFKSFIEVILTPKEFALLETLIINRNLALSREKLIFLVWDYNYEGETRTVDVHIQKLRNKLGLENRIKTVYKMGYRLEL